MFRNDYSEIAAKEVLCALAEGGYEQNVGYGLDAHSKNAEKMILNAFGLKEEEASVHFLSGGTQTNMTVISYFLRPYEAVVACDTGHINVHETGAVEGSGHKVIACRNEEGKILPEEIDKIAFVHRDEHMVKPAMVYLSDSTETGTVYTAEELKAIRSACDRNGLLLFLDGARLGVALTAEGNDVTPALVGELCDAFYVGGTKNGALFGEAVVLKKKWRTEDFRYHIKNRGSMSAKGFVLGIEFERLFTDDLYFRLAKNSNETAKILRDGLRKLSIPLVGRSTTNQIFLRVERALGVALSERYGAELWEDLGKERIVRLVTSFATKKEDCYELLSFVKEFCA